MSARDRKAGSLAFLLQKLLENIDYRTERLVREVVVVRNFLSETGYYVCPRCDCLLDREFVRFCDRCGQRLNWQFYLHAKIRRISPESCSEIPEETTLR